MTSIFFTIIFWGAHSKSPKSHHFSTIFWPTTPPTNTEMVSSDQKRRRESRENLCSVGAGFSPSKLTAFPALNPKPITRWIPHGGWSLIPHQPHSETDADFQVLLGEGVWVGNPRKTACFLDHFSSFSFSSNFFLDPSCHILR